MAIVTATEVYTSMGPLLAINRVLGMASFRTPNNLNRQMFSNFHAVFYTVLLLITVVSGLWVAADGKVFTSLDDCVFFTWCAFSISLASTAVFKFNGSRSAFQCIFDDLVLCSKVLKHCESKMSILKLKRSVKIQLIFLSIFVLEDLLSYASLIRKELIDTRNATFVLAFRIWMVLNTFQWVQMYTIVLLLRKYMCLLNENIYSFTSGGLTISGEKPPVIALNQDTYHLVATIRKLKNVQRILHQVFKNANRLYGMTTLLLGTMILTYITLTFYVLFEMETAIISISICADYSFHSCLCTFALFAVFLRILKSCEDTHNEADKTGMLVAGAILNVENIEARRELHRFSMQLHHTKIRFTACGFFPLEYGLISSVAAAIVTYLVVLVQFKISAPGCSCPRTSVTEAVPTSTTQLF